MGSWTELMIEDMPIAHTKSYVDPELMLIFRETDKKVFKRSYSMRSKIVWGELEKDEFEQALEYQCNIKLIKDRLNIFGINFNNLKENFILMRDTYIEYNYSLLSNDPIFTGIKDKLKNISFEDYCIYLKYYFENRYNLENSSNPLYLLFNNEISMDSGIFTFSYNPKELIVIYAELLNGNENIVQDLSEVTSAGYYNFDDNVVSDCEQYLIDSSAASQQIYIFTEGSSDKFILENSLKILYPHLYDFFEFVDYEASNLDGGAHILTKMIKAFVGAKMPNKIVAIYDSDTAAYDSLESIKNLNIPNNIQITNYPFFDLLENYPTIGPTESTNHNIYKLAASIELYLGKDCLSDENGNLHPVIWKGYNEKLKRYQGEISHKKEIFDNFKKKLNEIKFNPNKSYDLSGLELIWSHIFKIVSDMQ